MYKRLLCWLNRHNYKLCDQYLIGCGRNKAFVYECTRCGKEILSFLKK